MDTLISVANQTKFPWLMSNVIDKETDRPLADGKTYHILEWEGRRIGLVRGNKIPFNLIFIYFIILSSNGENTIICTINLFLNI